MKIDDEICFCWTISLTWSTLSLLIMRANCCMGSSDWATSPLQSWRTLMVSWNLSLFGSSHSRLSSLDREILVCKIFFFVYTSNKKERKKTKFNPLVSPFDLTALPHPRQVLLLARICSWLWRQLREPAISHSIWLPRALLPSGGESSNLEKTAWQVMW